MYEHRDIQEQRSSERTKSWYQGTVVYTNSAFDCVVRSYSQDGARLAIDARCFLPTAFDLVIPTKSKTRRAHVRWRTSEFVGVEFDRSATTEATPSLEELVQDNERLTKIVAQLTQRLARISDKPSLSEGT